MRIRFQADADLNQIIVKATLRLEPSIEFQTAQSADLAGLSDSDVLRLAAEQGVGDPRPQNHANTFRPFHRIPE